MIISFPHPPGSGGPGSFQIRIEKALKNQGCKVVYANSNVRPDVVIVVGGTKKLAWLWRMKRSGVPILQRLDGISWIHRKIKTPFKQYIKAEYRNVNQKIIHAYFADYVVYQSRFVQRWWDREGFVKKKQYSIIHNGVDLQVFRPPAKLPKIPRLVALEGTIDYSPFASDLLNELAVKLPDQIPFELYGRFSNPCLQHRLHKRIKYFGMVSREKVPQVLQGAILLSLDVHPACPNTVIEALACGAPVVGFDTGAMKELVSPEAGEIVPYGGDPWKLDFPDVENLIQAAKKVLADWETYSKNARKVAEENYDLVVMFLKFRKYLYNGNNLKYMMNFTRGKINTKTNTKNYNILILQRSISNYRLSFFKLLSSHERINLTICAGKFDEKSSTGLEVKNFDGLNVRLVKIYKLFKDLLFQSIISIKPYNIIITDISINLISTPIYLLYARFLGKKVIGWGKGIPQNMHKKENLFKKLYKKFLASQCDSLILYGEVSKKYFNNLGLINKPKYVAQNTIDTNYFINNKNIFIKESKKLKRELKIKDKFIFGYLGRLSKRKKVDEIILAFKIVRSNYSEAFLFIAGSGLDEVYLKSLIIDWEHKESVLFFGSVPIGDEGIILNVFDAYLSFSQGGLGIIEAMASGCLIISTPQKYPETELLKNGENCLLSENLTVESFSKTMLRALELNDTTRKLSTNALNTVKGKVTIENMVKVFFKSISNSIK